MHNGILAQLSTKFVIAEIQAKELGERLSAAASHYSVKATARQKDLLALVVVATMIEGPMILGYMQEQAEKKKQSQMAQMVHQDPLVVGAVTAGLDGLH